MQMHTKIAMYNLSNHIPFYRSHKLLHSVVFNMKSHCLHVNPNGDNDKVVNFSHHAPEATSGSARITKWKNSNCLC